MFKYVSGEFKQYSAIVVRVIIITDVHKSLEQGRQMRSSTGVGIICAIK